MPVSTSPNLTALVAVNAWHPSDLYVCTVLRKPATIGSGAIDAALLMGSRVAVSMLPAAQSRRRAEHRREYSWNHVVVVTSDDEEWWDLSKTEARGFSLKEQ